MTTAARTKRIRTNRTRLLFVALAVVLMYVLLPQVGRFHDSLDILFDADHVWLVPALLCMFATFLAAAGVYWVLAKHTISFWGVVLVQVASMFANRLLPAGVGAIGVNFRFLRRNKHSKPEAGAVVAVNNLLGVIGNLLLVILLLVCTRAPLPSYHPHVNARLSLLGVAVVLLALLLIGRKLRMRLAGMIERLLMNVLTFRKQPLKLVGALLCSVILTALYAGILYASARAVGIDIPFAAICIIMSLGVAGGTAIPTPGGLGGAEAGLVAGLVLYGVSAELALPAALLYRFVTYWLPLLAGGIAFSIAVRRKLI